ncbi:MAG TPA: DHH family phosphoesterase [Phnomibacter sp.]|nr:DHH family phosphoesterase [Phnomibacter sp.]
MQPIQELYTQLLQGGYRIVVTFHQKPDADAMGSGLGLYHYLKALGHSVAIISPTNWAPNLTWMPGVNQVIDFDARSAEAEAKLKEADWIFCLDFNTLSRVKHMEPLLRQSSALRILIDHHQEPETAVFAYGLSRTDKCSTAEMVYDLIMESGGEQWLTIDIMICLYAGAMTDTGSFRFASTTAGVHRMVAHFKEKGLQHHLIHDYLYDNFLENRLRFLGHSLLYRMDVMYELNTVLIAIPKADLQRFDIQTGDTEGLVNFPLTIQGIKMAAIVIDRDEERKWSFRSKGDVDVNEFARAYFNGGGHKNAAGGRSQETLENTVAHFKEVIDTLKPVLE